MLIQTIVITVKAKIIKSKKNNRDKITLAALSQFLSLKYNLYV